MIGCPSVAAVLAGRDDELGVQQAMIKVLVVQRWSADPKAWSAGPDRVRRERPLVSPVAAGVVLAAPGK
ncbi:hypothetical protein [Streptoalloteichus hindustanus]|uniref:Uncharacterized protein n=1 Tax=Streptoalloteichus hindustanus TaxID=2017 RepID=A0A1M5K4X0_STRHI|nr:hypothetical protein [Streptoalloteichus hindustanus]SHG47835.1 hypothetical protein SAMN05444320_109144 [Streptoalloteichus hindustanus]